jgi:septal ring factor EnvC (AmiA/AmiB activator)
MSDSTSKGLFHQTFGVPFQTWVSGGSGQYQKDKQQTQQQLSQLQSQQNQQLKVQQDLAKQREQVEEHIRLLDGARTDTLSETEQLQQQRIDVEKRMKERRDYVFKPDPSNAPGALFWMLVGSLGVPGKVIAGGKTVYDLGKGANNERKDRKELKQVNQELETRDVFIDATKQEISVQNDQLKKIKDDQVANLNIIKTLQASSDQAKQKLDTM